MSSLRVSRITNDYGGVDGNFEKALDMYSEAIFCKVPKKQKAVYYSNRAFVNIKLENYAIALFGKQNTTYFINV